MKDPKLDAPVFQPDLYPLTKCSPRGAIPLSFIGQIDLCPSYKRHRAFFTQDTCDSFLQWFKIVFHVEESMLWDNFRSVERDWRQTIDLAQTETTLFPTWYTSHLCSSSNFSFDLLTEITWPSRAALRRFVINGDQSEIWRGQPWWTLHGPTKPTDHGPSNKALQCGACDFGNSGRLVVDEWSRRGCSLVWSQGAPANTSFDKTP